MPQAGRHPTTHWLPGEVVADAYRLELPAGTETGEIEVHVGMYDWTTLDRLPVTDPEGGAVPGDAVILGRFQVQIDDP